MSQTPHRRTAVSCSLLLVALAPGLAACGTDGHPLAAEPGEPAGPITLTGLGGDTRLADPAKDLEVTAEGQARITDVTAVDENGRYVRGRLSADGHTWRSTVPLAARSRYTVDVSTENDDGAPGRKRLTYRTSAAKAKKPMKVELGPEKGTYGVGQPLTVELSRAVRTQPERAVVERGLKVSSTPRVDGSWYWVDDKKLHYRPRQYWPAGARVRLESRLEGVKVREGVYAGAAKPVELRIGDRIEAVTDAAAHEMTVYRNGEQINSMPVTTGKAGFETRNGKKVVLEKQSLVRMTGASIGVGGTSEDYDLQVSYATRVTWSGEYVHAAPWSVGSQGAANVSHGCTGMSTDDAAWFYKTVRPGDIVEVVNSYGEDMAPFGNGYGDWNLSWAEWRKGSALTPGAGDGGGPADANRLRPAV
ncbi:Ig-like domain-containing protein [Streptomyces sp. MAR4 CNX-425]|uniref:L,D-transpeptidase n=1 Tax=Streptomyces sp. MAR4 CNX-425 TaxID=3406343 RepID=UPI003B50C5AB